MVALFFWAASALGDESKERSPSANVTIHATRVAVGLGYTWGDGTLKYKDKEYKFKVSGLNAVGLGVAKLKAKGEVHDLENLDDFPGKYFGVQGGATMIQGSESLVMKNGKGVVINLRAEQKGVELKLGNEGLSISPAWD
jgi:hypothetical protein